MKKLVYACAIILALSGCWSSRPGAVVPEPTYDTIDILYFNGIYYHDDGSNSENTLRIADLGGKAGEIKTRVGDAVHSTDYTPVDWDASILPPKTIVYKFIEYNPEFRLAVILDGKVKVYEAFINPRAEVGQDLLDIGGKVVRIAIQTWEGEELAGIDAADMIAKMVNLILTGTAERDRAFLIYADSSSYPMEDHYYLCFYLKDGTKVTRSYWPNCNLLSPVLFPGEGLDDLIQEALD